MSTTPPAVQSAASRVTSILTIINAALKGLTMVPIVGAPAGLAEVFISIIQGGMAAYQAEAGRPLDLTKIPLEAPVD